MKVIVKKITTDALMDIWKLGCEYKYDHTFDIFEIDKSQITALHKIAKKHNILPIYTLDIGDCFTGKTDKLHKSYHSDKITYEHKIFFSDSGDYGTPSFKDEYKKWLLKEDNYFNEDFISIKKHVYIDDIFDRLGEKELGELVDNLKIVFPNAELFQLTASLDLVKYLCKKNYSCKDRNE